MAMHKPRCSSVNLLACIGLASCLHAASPQKGTAYYTDVHGSGALIRCMHAMGKLDKQYYRYRDDAIPWFVKQRHAIHGGTTWIQNPSAPPGHPSYHSSITTVSNFNAATLLMLYQQEKKESLLQPVKDHIAWLKATARKKETPDGPAYAWQSKHVQGRPMEKRIRPLTSGHSWGTGSTLEILASYHLLTGDESVLPYMEGAARMLYHVGEKQGGGKNAEIFWKWGRGGQDVAGYCRGNAGTAYGLLKIAEAAPGMKITKHYTIEDVINGNLRHIIRTAMDTERGMYWENLNGHPGMVNVGFGRGTSGIGLTLWMGHLMNEGSGSHEMARRCRRAAEQTVTYFLYQLSKLQAHDAMTEAVEPGRLQETVGLCSGVVGAYLWIWPYADALHDKAFSRQCDEAIRKMAYRLINSAYTIDGSYAWLNHNPKFGDHVINMAIDHGQTGVVYALAEIGARLHDDTIIDAAKRAAQFVINHVVAAEGGGIKMPHIVTLPAEAKPLASRKDSARITTRKRTPAS